MPKIIILDPIAQEGLELLAAAPGIEYEVRTGLKGDALKRPWPSSTARSAAAA